MVSNLKYCFYNFFVENLLLALFFKVLGICHFHIHTHSNVIYVPFDTLVDVIDPFWISLLRKK